MLSNPHRSRSARFPSAASPFLSSLILAVGLLLSVPRSVRAQEAEVVISEFLAVNDSIIEDEDGDFSDYVELYNATDQTIDLSGWALTDDRNLVRRWTFPSVDLAPQGFLLVFASGKDRRNPARELHTDFELLSTGEFLALLRPNGTVAHGWNVFPPQVSDYSYGLRQNADRRVLVSDRAACRVLVPQSGVLGGSWTARDFDDSSWRAGETGVGYDRSTDYRSLIRTDVRSETESVQTTVYVRIPFEVEGAESLSNAVLRMKYDDGFVAWINGTRVASANAPSTLRWDSAATAIHDDPLALVFQDFAVDLSGILVDGTNVLAIQALNDSLSSSDFLVLPELRASGAGSLEPDVEEFFSEPSPRGGNPPGYPGIARAPQFSVPATVFSGTLSLSISSSEPGAVVRFTIDGSEPGESSSIASGSMNLSESTLVRARAFVDGLAPSPIRTQGYVRLAENVRAFTSNIPVVIVENFGRGTIPNDPFQPAYMAIFEPTDGGRTRLDRPPELETRVGIKIRGSSTEGRPKKAYRIEAWDEKGQDRDIAPLGLPPEADWILYGAYNFDLALMRNAFIYELSRRIGVYAARTRFCEVYVNTGGGTVTDSDYVGVYSFMESIKRGPDRVDVESLDASVTSEPEIEGGYMLKIDRLDPGDSGVSAGGQRLGHVYPKEERITPEQRNWIRDYINEFVSVLNGSNFRDPVLGYERYIDVDLWIDHHILNVLSMNVDALRLSTYMYKARGGKLTMGPIWDFDRSMDSTDGRDNNPLTWNGTGDATRYFEYPWWSRLFADPDFWQRWIDRWTELRRNELSAAYMNSILDAMREEIREAAPRNFARWTLISGSAWPGEVERVKNYLRVRAEWIDSQFTRPPVVSPPGQEIEPGFEVTISAPAGEIWYTLDGSDPRVPGGAVSPNAIRYNGPVSIDENVRLFARARVGSNWSGFVAETYYTELPRLVISELMFHPPPPLSTGDARDEDYEFIELFNASDEPLDLDGFAIEGGVRFVFGPGEPLAPGAYVVVVKNLDAFEDRYGSGGIRIAGEYEGRLDNSGEDLSLFGPLREPVLSFAYSEDWYPAADGDGASIVILDPFDDLSLWGEPSAWAESTVVLGTPGEDDPGLTGLGGRRRPGDLNEDGLVDLSDAIGALRRLFLATSAPLPCEGSGPLDGGNRAIFDVNDDATFDLSDGVYLLEWIFKSGSAPVRGTSCIRIEGCSTVCF